MFDPTDEQIEEAAMYHAALTIREEATARRKTDEKDETEDLAKLWEEADTEGQAVS